MYEAQVQFLGHEDSWEKEMATLSSILAWRILWTEEPGRPQSTGSPRVGFDWSNLAHIHAINLWNSDQYKFVQPLWKQFGMSCKVEHTHMWGLSDKFSSTLRNSWDFPGGPDIKNPPSNAGDIGSIPGSGKVLGAGHDNPIPTVFLPGEFHGQRSLTGHSPQGGKELDTTEMTEHKQCQ